MIQQEEVLRISSCLDRLPVKLKEAVVLRFYQDLSFDEIAEITACSVGSAKMRVYRGLEGAQQDDERKVKRGLFVTFSMLGGYI